MTVYRVLGPLAVHAGDAALPIASRRQRALLTRLLLDPGRVVSAHALVESAWADEEYPKGPKSALQTQMSRLRALLGPLGEQVLTRAPGYCLDVAADDIDACAFEHMVRRARQAARRDARAALVLHDEALRLWRGPAYAEFAESFAQPEAARLEELRLGAVEERVEALLEVGDIAEAVAVSRYLTTSHPMRERPYALLMRGLATQGRREEALAVFRGVRERLVDELGAEPSEELRDVHLRVLRGEVDEPDQRDVPTVTAVGGTRPAVGVPLAVSGFVGRQAELSAVGGALGGCRVVTLVGPGGVGKTRLAAEVVTSLGGVGDVVWVELASVRGELGVWRAVLGVLGGMLPSGGLVGEAVVELLRGREVTVVLDDCEHVVEQVASVVSVIVRRCGGVRVLATSRERLCVDGEWVVPLSGLPCAGRDAPAVRLLLDRLTAAGCAADVDGAGVRALAEEVCRRLDGLPLALELAGAQGAALGLESLVDMADPLALVSRRRGVSGRHRGLREVLSWSFDLLSPGEQVLLRRLSVFPGRFSLDWVRGVCAGGVVSAAEVAGLVACLVDKSLVTRRPGPAAAGRRFALLSTVGRFAGEQLAAAGEEEHVRAAHARFAAAWAERWARVVAADEDPEGFALFAAYGQDLRAACAWAHRHDPDLVMRLTAALYRWAELHIDHEVLGWAEAALRLPGTRRHHLRPVVLVAAAGAAAHTHGDPDLAERLCLEAIKGLGPPDQRSVIVFNALGHYLHNREPAKAAVAHRRAWHAARQVGDAVGETEAASSLAIALNSLGNAEGTARWLVRTRAAASTRSPVTSAMVDYATGECLMLSAPGEAAAYLAASHDLASSAGVHLLAAMALTSKVTLQARSSPSPQGVAAYGDVLRHWCDSDGNVNEWNVWITLRNLIPVLSRHGQDSAALALHYAIARSPRALRTLGPESRTLRRAVARSEQRLGPSAVTRLGLGDGRATVKSAVEIASDAIERILARHTVHQPPSGARDGAAEPAPRVRRSGG